MPRRSHAGRPCQLQTRRAAPITSGPFDLRKSLFHEREILVKICRKDCPFIPEKAIFHYRDIYDHLAKFFELTETYRDLVTSLMEMYLSMLNNQMTAPPTRQTYCQTTNLHHHYLHAAHAFGWNRWHVGVVYDDRTS